MMNQRHLLIILCIVVFSALIGCTSSPTPTPTLRPTHTAIPTETPPPPSPPPATPTSAAIVGDAVRGEQLFHQGLDPAPACINCPAFQEQGYMLGPVIAGIAERAANRVEGLSAAAYIRQSIVEPSAYLVGGYRNLMYAEYGVNLSEQDLADLVAYLETL